MQRFYGIDLLDLYRGTLSARKAYVLIQNLPPGAMLYREIDSPAAWSESSHILSMIEHTLRILAWQPTDYGRRGIKVPKPMDRPGYKALDEEKTQHKGKVMTIEEMNEWLGWN